jgi:hypothetical protein
VYIYCLPSLEFKLSGSVLVGQGTGVGYRLVSLFCCIDFVRMLSSCYAHNRNGWAVVYVRLSAFLRSKILMKFGINISPLVAEHY